MIFTLSLLLVLLHYRLPSMPQSPAEFLQFEDFAADVLYCNRVVLSSPIPIPQPPMASSIPSNEQFYMKWMCSILFCEEESVPELTQDFCGIEQDPLCENVYKLQLDAVFRFLSTVKDLNKRWDQELEQTKTVLLRLTVGLMITCGIEGYVIRYILSSALLVDESEQENNAPRTKKTHPQSASAQTKQGTSRNSHGSESNPPRSDGSPPGCSEKQNG